MSPAAKATVEQLNKTDRDHLIHPLHHPSDHLDPLIHVSARGSTVRDINGNEYLDGLSGLWNVNIGHGRSELAEAAADQMKDLAYFSAYIGTSHLPAIELAARLMDLVYDNMQAVFFTCGGAEANETAFKTARFYWKASGRPEKVKVISRQEAYHGVTLQAMSATKMGTYWKMFEPRVPGFVHAQSCYAYRFQGARPGETVGQAAARELEETILREGPETVAAVIGEPIHGAGGVIYPTEDYWPLVREICTRHDVLFIADEIITGFCRTGKWFGLSHWNVKPDMMTFAKGVTSGYLPLGGLIVSAPIKEAMDSVEPANRWMHGYTYSAHPTCCAVALKNLEIMEREHLWENASNMGDVLHSRLQAVFGDHPNVGDIRGGKGMLAAVEFVEDRDTKRNFTANARVAGRMMGEMRKNGLITRVRPAGGPHPAIGDSLLFAPPLVMTETEVVRMVDVARGAAKVVFGV